MEGPLFDDWYLRITVAPPYNLGEGPSLLLRWTEPTGDHLRRLRTQARLSFAELAEWIEVLTLGYLQSRASGIRRAISAMERAHAVILA